MCTCTPTWIPWKPSGQKECMCMATWKWSQERPAEAPSRRPAAECSGATWGAPVGDTMPSPHRTAVGLHCTKKIGGLSMENGEVLYAAKRNWEERQLQTTHLPHTSTR